MSHDYHDFAMLIRLSEPNRITEWERQVRRARPAQNMSVDIRKPDLIFFAIQADTEFEAIERAQQWLQSVATLLFPPITLSFNAQPSEEI